MEVDTSVNSGEIKESGELNSKQIVSHTIRILVNSDRMMSSKVSSSLFSTQEHLPRRRTIFEKYRLLRYNTSPLLRKEPDNRWDPEISESLPGLHCRRKGFVFLVNRHRTNLTKLMPEWISIIPEILAKKQVFCGGATVLSTFSAGSTVWRQ